MAASYTGLIDEVVSPGAKQDLIDTTELLRKLEEQMAKTAGKSLNLNVDGNITLQQLVNITKSAEESIAELTKTVNEYKNVKTRANEVDKQAAQQARVDEQIRRQQGKFLVEQLEQINREREKEAAQLEKSKSAYYQLNEEYKKAAQYAKDLGAQMEFLKRSGNEEGVKKLASTYHEASTQALALSESLYKIEIAVGQGQRKVGQYSLAAEGLRGILRDLPSFAFGASQGLMAIGNNIPMLQDGIKKLMDANKELVKAGKDPIPIWKGLMKELSSGWNILTMVITAVTILSYKWDDITRSFEKSETELDKLNKKFKEINDSAIESAGKKLGQASQLVEVINNINISEIKRIEAITELQKLMPNYLDGFSETAILAGEAKRSIDMLIESMQRQAAEEAKKGQIEEVGKNLLKAQNDLESYKSGTPVQAVGTFSGGTPTSVGFAQNIKKLEEEVKFWKKRLSELSNDTSMATQDFFATWGKNAQPRNVPFLQQQIALIDQQLKSTSKTIDEEKKLYARRKELQEEIDAIMGKNGKNSKIGSEFDADKRYQDALYNLNRQRLEQDAATNKAIMDDERNTIEKRLEAHRQYYNDLNAMADLAAEHSKSVEQIRIQKDEEKLKNKDLTPKERKALLTDIAASNVQIKALDEKLKADRIKISNDSAEAILAIQRDEIRRRLNLIKDGELREETEILIMQEVDLQNLKLAFDNKEISLKEYNKRKHDIEIAGQKVSLKLQIDAADAELALMDKNSNEYLTKLNERLRKSNQLLELENPDKKGKKKTGLEDDFLAQAAFDVFKPGFGDDEETAKKAAKEFSNYAVSLTRETTDLIKSIEEEAHNAKMQQYERESLAAKKSAEDQIKAIQATQKSSVDKANAISSINAQLASKESEIEARKKQENIKHFNAIQAAAKGEALINGSLAVTKIWAEYSANPVAAAILTGLVVAQIAEQITKIQGQQPPAYKYGTASTPRSEFAYVGDGGEHELIKEPGRSPYWSSDKTELRFLPKGTSVTPMSQIISYAQKSVVSNSFSERNKISTHQIDMIRIEFDELKNSVDKQTKATKDLMFLLGMKGEKDIIVNIEKSKLP